MSEFLLSAPSVDSHGVLMVAALPMQGCGRRQPEPPRRIASTKSSTTMSSMTDTEPKGDIHTLRPAMAASH